MLTRLSIRDVLLIEKLDLDFKAGLNVLSGETGAGKSILLDCLGFVLGWRGRADLVRPGAGQGEVIAEFELDRNHAVWHIIEAAGIAREDVLILRRVVSTDGRKRGYVNDRSVSGELLRQIGEQLVEMHGQHDDKGLMDDKTHLGLLDDFGRIDLRAMALYYGDWRKVEREWRAYQTVREEREREADFIRHAADELGKLAAQPGEEAALDAKRRLMQQSERLAGDVAELLKLLGAEGIGDPLGRGLRLAGELGAQLDDSMRDPIERLSNALDLVADAERDVANIANAMEFSPHELEETEERLFAIRGAARKYQCAPDELPAIAEKYQGEADALDMDHSKAAELETALVSLRAQAEEEAAKLRAHRLAAADKLSAAMASELAPLKMENARFETALEVGELGATGMDRARFIVQTNPGAPAGALSKIASGGELSRFLLALKLCLRDQGGATMIFDEIDRGVGGATADAVGRRLRRLADNGQLLVVTHSPQVAAMASQHFRVAKSQSADSTLTDVRVLDPNMRIDEIVRMISGDQITDEARAAAQALIENA